MNDLFGGGGFRLAPVLQFAYKKQCNMQVQIDMLM